MMKKIVVVLMAAGLLLVTGCGESEKVLEGEVQNMSSDSTASGGTEMSQSSVQGQGEEHSTGTEEPEKGYVFTFDGMALAADTDVAPVIEQLGEPVSYFEAASCAFDGLDKMYTYSSLEIDTYPVGDKDYISAIILKDDSVPTPEGIYIGDSLENLQQTYGSEYTEKDGMIVYEKDGMELCFIMKNKEIASIEYRSTVLKE